MSGTPVRAGTLPPTALLQRYERAGAFADCYVADLDAAVGLPAFVEAFYTSPVFRLERGLIGVFAGRRAGDADARALAAGAAPNFSAWRVEAREHDQLLLADFSGRTRSWLMVGPGPDGGASTSTLFFGSAVLPKIDRHTGERRMGAAFPLLLGFHRQYSRALLQAARTRLRAALPAP